MKLTATFVTLSIFVSSALSAPLVQQVGSALGMGGTSHQVQQNDYSGVAPGNDVFGGGGASSSNTGTAGIVSQVAPSLNQNQKRQMPLNLNFDQALAPITSPLQSALQPQQGQQQPAKRLLNSQHGSAGGYGGDSASIQDNDYSQVAPGNSVSAGGSAAVQNDGTAGSVSQFVPSGFYKRLVGPLAGATKSLPVPLGGRDVAAELTKRLVGPLEGLSGLGKEAPADSSRVPNLVRRTRYQYGSVEGHGGTAYSAQNNDVSQVAPGNEVNVGGGQTVELSGLAGGLTQHQ